MNQIYLPSTTSTNAWLQDYCLQQACAEGTLVYTSYQTNGRGQLSNKWESEAGKNLLLSMLFTPTWLPVKDQFILSQAVALGVVDFLRGYDADFQVKWPNDIYWRGKKIAGILIENHLQGSVIGASIVGIGLNINQLEFLSDAPNPVSLAQITHTTFELKACLEALHQALWRRYTQAQENPQQIREDYLSVLYRYRQWATYQDAQGVFEGMITDVENRGYLHILSRAGIDQKYAFKEVQFLL
jgi:BirA family biotin operon repressor/biotin-[acetyl-CoA-carboxylase] ligase